MDCVAAPTVDAAVSKFLLSDMAAPMCFSDVGLDIAGLLVEVDSLVRGPGQAVSLINGNEHTWFESMNEAQAAYETQARTRFFDGLSPTSGSLLGLLNDTLARATNRRTAVSVFVSDRMDAGFALHTDSWIGLVIQLYGGKHWQFGEALSDVTCLNAGQLLLIPPGVLHRVSTPSYSVHLRIAAYEEVD